MKTEQIEQKIRNAGEKSEILSKMLTGRTGTKVGNIRGFFLKSRGKEIATKILKARDSFLLR